ncbi:MAG: nucleoside deaminase [Paracoccaceae bacterium]|nr:nucleoside deaminase [Paracoccaceae bacterium]
MEDDKTFMARALEIARDEMLGSGAAPFGAVIVRDGKIVGEGVNRVVTAHDPTSHGEVEAIRDAGRNLGTWDLSGCTLYTTCEPCEMCVAAMYWAKIDAMVYACRLSDAEAIGFDLQPLTKLVRSDLADRDLPARQMMADEGRAVLKLWTEQPDFGTF